MYWYHVSTSKHLGVFKLRLKGWVLNGRRVLSRAGQGGAYYILLLYLCTLVLLYSVPNRVINKVAIETGFPCIPAIKENDGRGGHTHSRGKIIREWAFIWGNTVIMMPFRCINFLDQLFVRCHYQWSGTHPLLINQHFITVLRIVACVVHIWRRGKRGN